MFFCSFVCLFAVLVALIFFLPFVQQNPQFDFFHLILSIQSQDFDGRAWSGAAAAHAPPTSGMNGVQDRHARGGHSTSPARGGHHHLDKTCITSRRLGFLIDLE